MDLIIFVVILILGPIPIVHLIFHAFLPFWRSHPRAMYIMGLCSWLMFLPIAWYLSQMKDILFVPPGWLIILSKIFIVISAMIVIWAMKTLTLRRFFLWAVLKPTKMEQKHIHKGPYRYLSHPAYTSYMLTSIFVFLATGSTLFLIFTIIFIFLMALVIYFENIELQKRLQSPSKK